MNIVFTAWEGENDDYTNKGGAMIKEYVIEKRKELIARIEDSTLISVENNQTDFTTLRLYLNGKVGLAKAIGSYDEIEFEKMAFQNVKDGPEYVMEPTSDKQIELVYNYMIAKGTDFVADMKDFMDTLHLAFPMIRLRDQIKLVDHTYQLINNNGVYLSYQDHILDIELRYEYDFQDKKRAGLFQFKGRRYEKENFVTHLSGLFQACLHPECKKPEKQIPLIISTQDPHFFTPLITFLNGENYSDPSSYPASLLGKAYLHSSFSFFQSRDPEIHFIPFFDAEGVVNDSFRTPLIQDGVLKTPYTNKKISHEKGLPLTGSSHSKWGEMPQLQLEAFDIQPTHQNLSDILQGESALLLQQLNCAKQDGSDMVIVNAEQVFLTDGKSLLGCLPPITFSVSWKDLFSNHFHGVTIEPIIPFSNHFGFVLQSVPYQWKS